ncbi:hypothetical protein FB451DRAFT_1408074 [Mycena latifolia]|nr:hypothetical protein FB451DRAFT_1408074 [Mycena latifolia]
MLRLALVLPDLLDSRPGLSCARSSSAGIQGVKGDGTDESRRAPAACRIPRPLALLHLTTPRRPLANSQSSTDRADHHLRVGVGRDSRGGAMHARVRFKSRSLVRTESAQSTRRGPPTRRATVRPRMPRAQERPTSPRGGARVWLAALVLVSPRSPWVSWPRRLGAPSGGGLCAVCGHACQEPRMHDSAGCVARASLRQGHITQGQSQRRRREHTPSRRVLCALTKFVRRCLSDTA